MAPRIDQQGSNTIDANTYIRFSTELIKAEREIRATTEAAAAARGVKSAIHKRMKSAGCDMEVHAFITNLAKMDDDERAALLRMAPQYAAWIALPLWVTPTDEAPQGSLLGEEVTEASERHNDARVELDGWNSHRAGGGIELNPHPPASRDAQTWEMGWRDGEADAKARPAGPVTASTEPKKRGRPAKAKPAEAAPGAATEETPAVVH